MEGTEKGKTIQRLAGIVEERPPVRALLRRRGRSGADGSGSGFDNYYWAAGGTGGRFSGGGLDGGFSDGGVGGGDGGGGGGSW